MPDRDMLLDSNLDSVEIAEAAVLQEAHAVGFGEEELHQLGMAVRESMVNAVVHGNRYNAR
jgi:serine/threonine-protein kinase RsbW